MTCEADGSDGRVVCRTSELRSDERRFVLVSRAIMRCLKIIGPIVLVLHPRVAE